MLKAKHFLAIVATVAVVASYFIYRSVNATSAHIPEAEALPMKVPSAMDTLVMTYDTLLSAEIENQSLVGAAIVLVHKGQIIHLKCYGVRQAGGNDSIDQNTIFRLASVSKTVTGVLAGILANEGVIGLDEKVVDYLPDFNLKDSSNTQQLSIRHLLNHTSGLVPHAYDNMVEAKEPFDVIMDSMRLVNLSGAPGELYGYQNAVFSLYDTIVTLATSKKFEVLLQEKVFEPFGMTDASAGFEPFRESSNKAYPHSGNRLLRLNDRYYNTNPAAGINASINDLGKMLVALSGKDIDLLSRQVTDTILSPMVLSPLRRVYLRKWNGVESKHYGLGWRIIGYKGRQVAYHGGYVRGYRAEIALCRDEDIGIAFLTNSPGSVGSMAVPLLLDMVFEESDSVNARFHDPAVGTQSQAATIDNPWQ